MSTSAAPEPKIKELVQLASRELGIDEGKLVELALRSYLVGLGYKISETPIQTDERDLEQVRSVVQEALAVSRCWRDFKEQLAHVGLEYYECGGGLAVRRISTKKKICKASLAGPAYSRLIARFKAPFPGHSHAWLANRVLKSPPQSAAEG